MAFVINKQKSKSIFQTNTNFPGPGNYTLNQLDVNNLPAPFNSSVYKKSCFQVQQSKIGPGSYDNVIKSDCFKSKSVGFSSRFNPNVKRFEYEKGKKQLKKHQSQQLIPADISFIKSRKQKRPKKHVPLVKPYSPRLTPSQPQLIRIILANPNNTQTQTSLYINKDTQIKQNNGPGMYQPRDQLFRNKSVINWNRDRQKRFSKKQGKGPGPADYYLDKHTLTRNKKTASFSYSGVRSYIDTIIYKTNNNFKARILESSKVKDKLPGPADYSPQKLTNESFYYGKECLGSTVQRFQIQIQKSSLPGPGSYSKFAVKQPPNFLKQVRQKIFSKDNSLSCYPNPPNFIALSQQLKQLQSNLPSKQQPICTLKQRCQSRLGSINQEQRFVERKDNKPGPGYYIKDRKTKNNGKVVGAVFKSKLERQPFQTTQSVQGFYDVGVQDIGYRNQKMKQTIQNLKRVSIEKPPFNSNSKRFDIPQKQQAQPLSRRQMQKKRQRQDNFNQAFRPYNQKKSYKSVFRSSTCRDLFSCQRNPGPGSYQRVDMLNKKSFNSQYDKSLQRKSYCQKPFQQIK